MPLGQFSTPDARRIADATRWVEAHGLEPRRRRRVPRGGDSTPLEVHRVRVKKVAGEDGGEPGDAETRCSFVYDLYPFAGVWDDMTEEARIAENVSTVWGRADFGRYRAAGDGTEAIAARDPNLPPDDPEYWFLLYVADEVEETAICDAAAP